MERFKEINEAYQILSNENKRAQYDSFGHIYNDSSFSGSGDFGSNINDLFGNLFDEVFSGGFGSSVKQRGNDLKYEIKIDFEEAAFGIEKEITISKNVTCNQCEGNGAAPEGESRCNECKGRGSVDYANGFLSISQTCRECRGRGYIITKYCNECNGAGSVKIKHKVKVKIPAGISNESRLRIRNEGEPELTVDQTEIFISLYLSRITPYLKEKMAIYTARFQSILSKQYWAIRSQFQLWG